MAEALKEGLLTHGNTATDLISGKELLSEKLLEVIPEEELPQLSQKMLSYMMDKQLQLALVDSLTDERDKARLASLGLAHSGDWLNVVPSPILGLHIRPQEFRYSVLYRLGAPLYPSSSPCPSCQKLNDRLGDH